MRAAGNTLARGGSLG